MHLPTTTRAQRFTDTLSKPLLSAFIVPALVLLASGIGFAQPQVKLLSGDASTGTLFDQAGKAIAFDGSTVAVGSYIEGDQSGSVYIYGDPVAASPRGRTGTLQWGRLAKLVAPDARPGERFGYSVAVEGDAIIVGAPGLGDGNAFGSVYIFQRGAERFPVWNLVAQLTAPDAGVSDRFGSSVAIVGTTLVIGSPGDSADGSSAGAAYVFERQQDADAWVHAATLAGSDAEGGSQFGFAVAIDGDNIVVGAMGHQSVGFNSGAAYVFSRHEGGENRWGQSSKLVASDPAQGANFGMAVAIAGGTIVVGASGDSRLGQNSGAAYVFEQPAGLAQWNQTAKLVPNDLTAGDLFGYRGAVAISGDTIAIGALGNDTAAPDAGTVFLFKRSEGELGQWRPAGRLTAQGAVEMGRFGSAVAISGENIAVAAETDAQAGKDAGLTYVAAGAMVLIDIEPGMFPNEVNPLKTKGVITVAVFTTTVVPDGLDFDATTIDPTMTTFGKTGIEKMEKHGTVHIEDVDTDGDMDAVLHFNVQSSGILCSDTMAIIQGKTTPAAGAADFMGMDSIQTVGQCNKKSDVPIAAGVGTRGAFIVRNGCRLLWSWEPPAFCKVAEFSRRRFPC